MMMMVSVSVKLGWKSHGLDSDTWLEVRQFIRNYHIENMMKTSLLIVILLKLVSAIFYQIFISHLENDSPSKTMKNAFYFI